MIEVELTLENLKSITTGSSSLRREVREWLDKNCGHMMGPVSGNLISTNNKFSGWCFVHRMPQSVRTNSGHNRIIQKGGTFMQFIRPKHAVMFKMRWL